MQDLSVMDLSPQPLTRDSHRTQFAVGAAPSPSPRRRGDARGGARGGARRVRARRITSAMPSEPRAHQLGHSDVATKPSPGRTANVICCVVA